MVVPDPWFERPEMADQYLWKYHLPAARDDVTRCPRHPCTVLRRYPLVVFCDDLAPRPRGALWIENDPHPLRLVVHRDVRRADVGIGPAVTLDVDLKTVRVRKPDDVIAIGHGGADRKLR